MGKMRAYLDYNASAPLLKQARDAMLAALDEPSNASSVHAHGRSARGLVDEARRAVAALVGGGPAHVVFTSGATEAANTLLTPDWRMGRAPLRFSRLYVCAADHPCTLSGGRFAREDVERLPVGRDGVLDLDGLRQTLAKHDRDTGLPMVSVHAANNETGVIQPIGEIAAIVKAAGGFLIVDAVQAAGRVPIDLFQGWGDFLILSSHKLGGPQGAGAIVGVSDLAMPVPLMTGGGQEKGHRAGTENVAAIAGFGAAARVAADRLDAMRGVAEMRDRFEAAVLSQWPDAAIYGIAAPRIGNTLFFGVPGLKAETAQIALDLAGISVSAGSACSSGKVGPSHVLAAMGLGDDASGLRVSIGHGTGPEELAAFAEALRQLAARKGSGRQAA
jgi:cysteine desulfurase